MRKYNGQTEDTRTQTLGIDIKDKDINVYKIIIILLPRPMANLSKTLLFKTPNSKDFTS